MRHKRSKLLLFPNVDLLTFLHLTTHLSIYRTEKAKSTLRNWSILSILNAWCEPLSLQLKMTMMQLTGLSITLNWKNQLKDSSHAIDSLALTKKCTLNFQSSFVFFPFDFPIFFCRCIISELRTTIKIILDLWKFFAEVTPLSIQIELVSHEFNWISQYKCNHDKIWQSKTNLILCDDVIHLFIIESICTQHL